MPQERGIKRHLAGNYLCSRTETATSGFSAIHFVETTNPPPLNCPLFGEDLMNFRESSTKFGKVGNVKFLKQKKSARKERNGF
jgi:hypothetical protein